MAEPENTPADDADQNWMDEELGESAGARLRRFFILCAGVVVIAAGAGYGLAGLSGCQGTQEANAEDGRDPDAPDEPEKKGAYVEFEPLVVNLDEPRLNRYVAVDLTMEVAPKSEFVVREMITRKRPLVKDWVCGYFMACSLSEVRGTVNQNRMKREIADGLNQILWPGGKPLIRRVLFTEIKVQ